MLINKLKLCEGIMKLVVLGGGGVRSIFLARALVNGSEKIGVSEIVFMDTEEQKLEIFGRLSMATGKKMRPELNFRLTTDIVDAVKGADYVITTMRVGGDNARIQDERVALNLGVLGQETTGPGGFGMALRSVPALLKYCEIIKKYANPNVLIFNFTNPSGIVTQALRDAGYDNVYGICDAPSGFAGHLQHILGVKSHEFEMRTYGLNHLSWFDEIKVRGEEVTEKLATDSKILEETHMGLFSPELIKMNGNVLLNEYLYFFFYREKAVDAIVTTGKTRGETIQAINVELIEALSKIDIENDTAKAFETFYKIYHKRDLSYMSIEANAKHSDWTLPTFEQFVSDKDEGGYAGVALDFIKGLSTGGPHRLVLSVPNNGSINGFDDSDVVEVTCVIDKTGVHPIKIGDVPKLQLNLMKQVKYYERNAVKAIQNRCKQTAIKALMAHPLVSSYSIAKQLLEGYLEVHKEYVGEWK